MGDASTEQRQNNWWSAWVAKQLHMKVETNGGRKHGTAPEQLVERVRGKAAAYEVEAKGGRNEERRLGRWGRCGEGTGKKTEEPIAERGWGDRARTCRIGETWKDEDAERAALGKPGRMKMLNQMDVEKESRCGEGTRELKKPGTATACAENGPTGRPDVSGERANRENRQCQRCVPSGCTRVHIEKNAIVLENRS